MIRRNNCSMRTILELPGAAESALSGKDFPGVRAIAGVPAYRRIAKGRRAAKKRYANAAQRLGSCRLAMRSRKRVAFADGRIRC
ncbi:hypothetical protein MESS2_1190034 [Mesorhizobium metallidurans STM 2683]|uniref:Uncharacterized protein n=1 Tax=Mesorhizobium metallidurans STM 2683 TaxID=1297569 RepID=M5EHC3_9HYPH|nr:hypothetical protein MESS2_1190034 [Mesorhizobium metallidurans STM 2683]